MHSKLTLHDGTTGRRALYAFLAVVSLSAGAIAPEAYAAPATPAENAAVSAIKGIVVDAEGEPVIGATIMVKGTDNGTSTDIDGRFALKAAASCELQVSYIGYEPRTVKVTPSARTLRIALRPAAANLDEVVVVGYGTMKKRDLIGAVDQIDSKVLAERSNTSVTRSLQGAIPNLNITMTDGKPTHNGSLNVRGTGSIGSGGSALVLIDGVEGDLASVNPQDVETISVLKDASSAAIYGARGAFGVILVTTKSAREGDAVVHYSGSVSRRERTVKPKVVTNGYQWLQGFMESYDGYYLGTKAYTATVNNTMPFSLDWVNEVAARNEDPNHEISRVNNKGQYEYFGNTDWDELWFKDHSYSTEHNLSISGGTKKADFYVSGRFYSQDGVYKVGDENYKQYNVRAKGNLQVRPWLRVSNNMDFRLIDFKEPRPFYGLQSPQRMMEHACNPLSVPRNPDGTWTYSAVQSGYAAWADGKSYETNKTTSINEKFSVEATAIKDVLKFSGDIAYSSKRSNRFRALGIETGKTGPEKTITVDQTVGTLLDNYRIENDYWATNLYCQFTPKLRGGNKLLLLAGWNVESRSQRTINLRREGLLDMYKPSYSLMDGLTGNPSQGGYEWSYSGIFFRANYSFRERYLIEFSGRYDGSSKFPENSKWGFFPSMSLGWRINEEKFMEGTRGWLDNLKLRASVGSMGNGNIAPYKYIGYLNIATSKTIIGDNFQPYTSAPGAIPLSLSWEKSTTYDVGLDLDMFNSRLSMGFDYYRRNTTDMYTVGVSLPAVFGTSAPKGNNASLRTDGWELSVQWRDAFKLAGREFSYSVKAMVWDASSKVTKYINPTGKLSDYYVGKHIGDILGYRTEGLFRDQEDIDNHAKQTSLLSNINKNPMPGDLKFKDLNNDNKIDKGAGTLDNPGDITCIGNSTPRYHYGFNVAANWNGIGISAFFQGVGKRDWYPRFDSGYFWGQYNRFYGYMLQEHTGNDVYRAELDNWNTAYWPRYATYQSHENKDTRTYATPNDHFLQNAAYLRLKNLTIDYTFSDKLCKKMHLKGLKVWLSGENLFTWTPLKEHAENFDPEVIESGDSDFRTDVGNGYSYPMQKVYTVGLNFTF